MAKADPRRTATLLTGRWARFDSYDIKAGAIRPRASATLRFYDPWEAFNKARQGRANVRAPYETLLELFNELSLVPEVQETDLTVRAGFSLDAKNAPALLKWCAEHGLLGILPHRARLIALPAERDMGPVGAEPGDEEGEWETVWGHVPKQQLFVRTPSGWRPAALSGDPNAAELPAPHVIMADLGQPVSRDLPLTALESFFPGLSPTSWPLPLSDEFWRSYAEPLQEFLSGAARLADAVRAASERKSRSRAVDVLNTLAEPVKQVMTVAGEKFAWKWSSPSLLATFGMMASQDLTERRDVRLCETCGKLFIASGYQTIYCSGRCRYREQKRRHRAKRRGRAKR